MIARNILYSVRRRKKFNEIMDKILFERKEYHKDKIEDTGGIKVFLTALIVTIVAFPFMMLYE